MKKSVICLLLIAALTLGVCAAFGDVQTHWAKANIEAMAEKEVLKGYPDGTFRPDGTLTRAEFLTVCVRFALGEQEAAAGAWWAPYAAAAKAAGWELPFDATDAEMAKSIDRQETAVLLKCAVNAVTAEREPRVEYTSPVLCATIESMKDYPVMEKELKDSGWDGSGFTAVDLCVRLGLITGYPDGEFKPHRTLTRAEAATVLCRLDSARTLWEQGGRFIVFTDSLKIWQTYDGNVTTIRSAKDGQIVSEITVTDECRDEWKLGLDIVNANGKYFWGEPGFYEYDESGKITQKTDLPAIDYGYDTADGSIVFLTHDRTKRVMLSGSGVWQHAADEVARLHTDGTVETLLAADAPVELAEAEQRGVLTKVDRATGGEVWVQMTYVMGMGDWHIYRVVVKDGAGTVVPTGLFGSGYSY